MKETTENKRCLYGNVKIKKGNRRDSTKAILNNNIKN